MLRIDCTCLLISRDYLHTVTWFSCAAEMSHYTEEREREEEGERERERREGSERGEMKEEQ